MRRIIHNAASDPIRLRPSAGGYPNFAVFRGNACVPFAGWGYEGRAAKRGHMTKGQSGLRGLRIVRAAREGRET